MIHLPAAVLRKMETAGELKHIVISKELCFLRLELVRFLFNLPRILFSSNSLIQTTAVFKAAVLYE